MDDTLIRELVIRERYFRDSERWDEWRACYHPDEEETHIDISWYTGTINPFIARSRSLAERASLATIHTTSPVDIRVRECKATVESQCQITSRFIYAGDDFDLIAHLRLISQLRKVDGRWYMCTLKGIYVQDSIIPFVPGRFGADAVWNDVGKSADVRRSYQCLIWNIERKGLTARRDLPGVDRPESVAAAMKELRSWLETE